jgi:hypothetical protein
MKLLCPMELKEFNKAKVRKTSVNRTAIRCRRTLNATVLRRVQIADENFRAFTIHRVDRAFDHDIVRIQFA